MTDKRLDGLEVAVHRSLVSPMLLVGLPRMVALVLWTTVAAFGFGLRQAWIVPIGILLHIGAAAVIKSDPHFFEIFIQAVKHGRRLEP